MGKKYTTSNSALKPFFDEINKYADDIHNLNEGTDMYIIEELENKLKIKLPKIFKEFLQICNGGELFATPAGTIISEIYDPSKGERKKGNSYLDESFMPERRWPNMPSTYLIIADTCDGDMICMDLEKSNENDAQIIMWSHETGMIARQWKGFADWLMNELEIGAMLINYDGSDK